MSEVSTYPPNYIPGDNGTLLVPRQSVGLKPPHDKEEVIIPEQVITEYRPFAVEATTKPASSGDS
jgi:hypothetical protein